MANRKSFQQKKKVRIAVVDIPGAASGTTTVRNACHRVAPSSCAACTRPHGSLRKKAVSVQMASGSANVRYGQHQTGPRVVQSGPSPDVEERADQRGLRKHRDAERHQEQHTAIRGSAEADYGPRSEGSYGHRQRASPGTRWRPSCATPPRRAGWRTRRGSSPTSARTGRKPRATPSSSRARSTTGRRSTPRAARPTPRSEAPPTVHQAGVLRTTAHSPAPARSGRNTRQERRGDQQHAGEEQHRDRGTQAPARAA